MARSDMDVYMKVADACIDVSGCIFATLIGRVLESAVVDVDAAWDAFHEALNESTISPAFLRRAYSKAGGGD